MIYCSSDSSTTRNQHHELLKFLPLNEAQCLVFTVPSNGSLYDMVLMIRRLYSLSRFLRVVTLWVSAVIVVSSSYNGANVPKLIQGAIMATKTSIKYQAQMELLFAVSGFLYRKQSVRNLYTFRPDSLD